MLGVEVRLILNCAFKKYYRKDNLDIMRLSATEVSVIKEKITDFDMDCEIYLFGSRTFDEKRGGDIDLLVLSKKITHKDIRQIKYALWEELGEQKIDIVLAEDDTDPFVKIALEGGILL